MLRDQELKDINAMVVSISMHCWVSLEIPFFKMSSTTYIKSKSIYYIQEGLYISNWETRAQLNLCKNIIYLQREIALRYESLASLLLSKNSWFWNVYISVFKHNYWTHKYLPTYWLILTWRKIKLTSNPFDMHTICNIECLKMEICAITN